MVSSVACQKKMKKNSVKFINQEKFGFKKLKKPNMKEQKVRGRKSPTSTLKVLFAFVLNKKQ